MTSQQERSTKDKLENRSPSAGEDREPSPLACEPDGGQQDPRITLDRYLSRRRPAPRPIWAQTISLVAMLIALLVILLYKERCGGVVASFFGPVQSQSASSTTMPAVRYEMESEQADRPPVDSAP